MWSENGKMIKYHRSVTNSYIAEILPVSELIASPEEVHNLMAEAGYYNSSAMILHQKSLHTDFLDLKTGLAGEILQKFSNNKMRLSIIGEFSNLKSRSLNDFIGENNRTGIFCLVNFLMKRLHG